MLPPVLLQPTEIATFDTNRGSPKLLPAETTESEVVFADILSFGVNEALAPDLAAGQALPHGGKFLPLLSLVGDHATLAGKADGLPMIGFRVPPDGPATVSSVAMPMALPDIEARAIPRGGFLGEGRWPQPGIEIPDMGRGPGRGPRALHDDGGFFTRQPAAVVTTLPTQGKLPGRLGNRAQSELPTLVATRVQDIAPTEDTQLLPARSQRLDPIDLKGARAPDIALSATSEIEFDGPNRDVRPLVGTTAAQFSPQVQANSTATIDAPVSQSVLGGAVQIAGPATPVASTPASAAAQVSQLIDIPVQNAAWGERIGERVLLMANNRLQSAEIRLSPPELGPLRVQIALDDRVATVAFHAHHAITREALEQAMPRLRELLAENGLTLNESDIGEQGVSQGSRNGADETQADPHSVADLPDEQRAEDGPVEQRSVMRPDGLVDTFV